MEPGLDERSDRICRLITEQKESVVTTCILVSMGPAHRLSDPHDNDLTAAKVHLLQAFSKLHESQSLAA